MRLPCETVVRDVLPAVRCIVAQELMDRGYTQTEIAHLLSITQPAVSQYLSAARGKQVESIQQHDTAFREIERLVDTILTADDDEAVSRTLHDVCIEIMRTGVFGEEAADIACNCAAVHK